MAISNPIPVNDLFDLERIPSSLSNVILLLYFPIGCFIFLLRLFVGIHAFLVACLLRKSTALRTVVMRVMCAVLGIVIRQSGERDKSVKMMCANHISALDHLAVDLVEPCILPSVWDIPSVIRWCFGYAELGARSGRAELVRQAKDHLVNEPLPLLAFPEGAITSGRVALLKFSPWSAEVTSSIQPVALRVWRPLDVRSSVLGAAWWTDVFWFLALPFTTVHLHWLDVIRITEQETPEQFSARLAETIATDLGIQTSNLTSIDAVEAAKRHLRVPVAAPAKRAPLDPRRMDEVAMRIKQSHPTVPLLAIRLDLDKTKDQAETINRIKSGKLAAAISESGKTPVDSSDWRRVFVVRKWEMIESNRARYLGRMQSDIDAIPTAPDISSEAMDDVIKVNVAAGDSC